MSAEGLKPIVSLITDFGHSDAYVGAMKGSIVSVAPSTTIVDICHDIPAGDILRAAFIWAMGALAFPEGTVHLGVVDPGVGTERKPIAVRTERGVFIAPDNGLLSLVIADKSPVQVRELTNQSLWRSAVSQTFHGRDLFGPVAGYLAAGGAFEEVGPVWKGPLERSIFPEKEAIADGVRAEVVYIDRFGNLFLNLRIDEFEGAKVCQMKIDDELRPLKVGKTFGHVPPGELVLYAGSSGYWELAINLGNASKVLQLVVGSKVEFFHERKV